MPDLQHAPGAPDAATRTPAAPAPDLEAPTPVVAPDELVRRSVGAAGGGAGPPGAPPGLRPTPHGLPPGAIGTAALLGIQRSAGNRAAAGLVAGMGPGPRPSPGPATDRGPQAAQRVAVQRQGAPAATPTFVIPIEPETTKMDLGSKAAYVRGSVAVKGEIKGELLPKGGEAGAVGRGTTSNVGVQEEITLAEQKGYAIFDSLGIEKVKETLGWELSKKKIDISIGAEASFKSRYPWLTGIVGIKGVLAGIEWEGMAKDPGSQSVLGLEVYGGLNGEGTINLNSTTDLKLSVKVVGSGEAHPNWPRIVAEVGKRAAVEGGKAAVQATTTAAGTTVLAIDMAAVASAAAVILIPLAAAIAMGYGAWQGMQNARAAREAAGYGVIGRKKAEECAKGFARTLTGSSPGSDEGSAEAEAQIQAAMTATNATREMVVAAATQEQGGYEAIYAKNLKRIKERIYADLVAKWFAANEENFGYLESLGDDWGQKGVFKSTLRIVLFGD